MNIFGSGRLSFIGTLMTLFAGLVVFQMARIQMIDSGRKLEQEGEIYQAKRETVYPKRGDIYDRYGTMLAGSREVYEVGIDLRFVTDPDTLAKEVSSILDLDFATVLAKADTDYVKGVNEYYMIAPFVEPDKVKQLEERTKYYHDQASSKKYKKDQLPPNMDGLEYRPRLVRSYPEKTLASNLVGFYSFRDQDGPQPFFGVEEHYNQMLAGTPVDVVRYVDPNKVTEIPQVPPGASLILTIDREIQAEIEKVLDRAVENSGSTSGTIIVLDPETGEILAMATQPRMDLNQYWQVDDIYGGRTPYNRAIGETYEPGSVFKVLTMAAALDAGVVQPDTQFVDTGVFYYGGYPIYNWDRGAWGPQTMLGCMQHSLNVCLSWIAAEKLGAEKFYSYMKAFGIGRRTNVDLAGELYFPLSVPGDVNWYDVNLATNSFGQGLAVSPLQLASAISAVANDGKLMQPHILKAYIDDGVQRDNPLTVLNTPISAETAHKLTDMLAISLEEEASDALVPGYRVAGKTGTGEIPGEGGYTTSLTNASFVGWGPVDDPKFLVYIWLEKPTSSPWGSIVAAPVFSEVAQKLVLLMNIPPDDARSQLNGQ